MMKIDNVFNRVLNKTPLLNFTYDKTLNLIASENRISPYVRRLLSDNSVSRYAFESDYSSPFPGGEKYLIIQKQGEEILKEIGKAKFVNMRPLSGLHAMTVVILALTKPNQKILSLSPSSGGHYATGPLSTRMGRYHYSFDLTSEFEIKINDFSDLIQKLKPDLVYIDQCHGLIPIDIFTLNKIIKTLSPKTKVHADMSHGLGLVFSNVLENPLDAGCDSYGGSTHKTFSGPQKGVLLTNDELIANKFIETQFHTISNHHLNSALCLSAALWEFKNFNGEVYGKSIPKIANFFANRLDSIGITPIKINDSFTNWHQIWIPESSLPIRAREASFLLSQSGIMVNCLTDIPGIKPYGLRLGINEIAHCGVKKTGIIELVDIIKNIIYKLKDTSINKSKVTELISEFKYPYDYAPIKFNSFDIKKDFEINTLISPWSNSSEKKELFVKAFGSYIYGVENECWIDAKSGALNANLGHGRVDIANLAYQQMHTISSSDASTSINIPAVNLSTKIAEITKLKFKHTLFCNSGSEATEAAIKIALLAHQSNNETSRNKFISFEGSYHGCTLGALALSQLKFPKLGLDLPKDFCISLPMPKKREDISEIKDILKNPSTNNIAAVILEPIQGIGGINIFPDDYLVELSKFCSKEGIFLIFDEVFTGFGRTGKMFAYEYSGCIPDILLTSKGLSAGYTSLSSISMTSKIYDLINKDPYLNGLRHGHTMSGNPLSCSIGVNVIDIILKENIIDNSYKLGKRILEKLSTLVKYSFIVDVRGRGLMIGIQFINDKIASEAVSECYKLGLLVRSQADVLQVLPPLNTSIKITDRIVEIIEQTIYSISQSY